MARNQDLPAIPKMYLAQIEDRCSLQYAAEDEDRQQWLKEWVDPKQDGKPYIHGKPILKKDKNKSPYPGTKFYPREDTSIYCLEIKFDGRIVSNCGQDSILRPVLGKNGIPYIPGSSIKGLFRRVCNDRQKLDYCGSSDSPGKLRFHGAYPIDDWAGKKVLSGSQGDSPQTRYLIEDIVHPQQKRQVETQDSPSAYVLISFYKPTMIFEFSSTIKDSDEEKIDWQEVETILTTALRQGLGGKTSTGYGFSSSYIPEHAIINSPLYSQAIHIELEGTGVSSKLLSGEPEFRPNMFKAALRGHISRLLAGVCNNRSRIQEATDKLFGSTNSPGITQIYWQQIEKVSFDSRDKRKNNPVYKSKGILHILAPESKLEFLKIVLQFAYMMGGFGKTWRRVSHDIFFPSYLKQDRKFDIGCNWISPASDIITINNQENLTITINNQENLTIFIDQLYQSCQTYLGISSPTFVTDWRETWHPENVVVFSQVVNESQAIDLFHDDIFKYTPAIGGRQRQGQPTSVSSVWHRMLPIGDGNYLEIVTVFHGDRTPWNNQLKPFIKKIKNGDRGLKHTWGIEPQ
jgi:CRISPR-associated protein Cmr6